MSRKMKFTIEQEDGCWSFAIEDHGKHMGYPSAQEAFAAALRFYDPGIPRMDAGVADVSDHLAQQRREKLRVVNNSRSSLAAQIDAVESGNVIPR